MIVINVDPEHPDARSIEEISGFLRKGKIAAIPTETYYALATDPFNRKAVGRIFSLKGMQEGKAILMLIPDVASVFELVSEVPEPFQLLAGLFWPGPLTLIMKCSVKVPEWIHGATGKVGLRISSNKVASEILKGCGTPLTGTSANMTGKLPAVSAAGAERHFGDRLDLIVDAGEVSGGSPSTLLDISSDEPLLLREGRISRAEIEEALGRRVADATSSGSLLRAVRKGNREGGGSRRPL